MKTAIILSGQLRNFEQCYPSLKAHILDHNECDIYLQTYITEEYNKGVILPVGIGGICTDYPDDYTI